MVGNHDAMKQSREDKWDEMQGQCAQLMTETEIVFKWIRDHSLSTYAWIEGGRV